MSNYTFCGATPTQIGYLKVTLSYSNSTQQLSTQASPTFKGTVMLPEATSTGVLTFPTTMTLESDLTGSRIVL